MSFDDIKYLVPFIAAVVAVLGWLVNDLLKRRAAWRDARGKKVDYMRALMAEIKAYSNSKDWTTGNSKAQDLASEVDRAREKFTGEGGEDYVPFVPSEKHDTVFEALVHDIHVLPGRTIYSVVVYYNQIRSIHELATDMRTAEYARLTRDQRQALLMRYLEMQRYSYVLARKAVHVLTDELKRIKRRQ